MGEIWSKKCEQAKDGKDHLGLAVRLEHRGDEAALRVALDGREGVALVDGDALPVDPLVSTWGVERRGEFSPLGPRAGCFLALGSGLGLVGTASARR